METGLYGKNGRLLGESAAKYRQVQHYIELLRHLPLWSQDGPVRVVDAGCGKAYLSLALCLWAELNGARVELTGVDSSAEVIATVARIADRTGLESATFRASSIAEFAATHDKPVDLLLSLHACDTATDEALAAGVRLGAKSIVLVPCCHHELVAQIEKSNRGGTLPRRLVGAGAQIRPDAPPARGIVTERCAPPHSKPSATRSSSGIRLSGGNGPQPDDPGAATPRRRSNAAQRSISTAISGCVECPPASKHSWANVGEGGLARRVGSGEGPGVRAFSCEPPTFQLVQITQRGVYLRD